MATLETNDTVQSASSPDSVAQDALNDGSPASTQQQVGNANTRRTFEQVLALHKEKNTAKIVILFKATGNAPILKQSKFTMYAHYTFQVVSQFLRKRLNYQGADPLFLYINSAFAPAPDEVVGDLFKCFNTDGQLIINYCTTAAWG